MRLISACLASSVAVLAATSLSASAGDLSNGAPGGIKDFSYGTPVPAPMPVDETYKWYVRGDIGSGLKTTGKASSDGLPVSFSGPNDWRELSILSLGFGAYVTPSFRTELTVDIRPNRNLATGVRTLPSFSQTASSTTGGVTTTATNVYGNNSQLEDITYQNNTFLASAFYDFNRTGRLKPYIGGGLGFGYHQLRRNGGETYNCTSGTTTIGAAPPTAGCSTTNGLQTTIASSSTGGANGYGLAAQLSAGVTYDLTQRIHWDTGYRLLWQSGHLVVASAEGLNSVSLGDHTDHEIRTGLRWDLW